MTYRGSCFIKNGWTSTLTIQPERSFSSELISNDKTARIFITELNSNNKPTLISALSSALTINQLHISALSAALTIHQLLISALSYALTINNCTGLNSNNKPGRKFSIKLNSYFQI